MIHCSKFVIFLFVTKTLVSSLNFLKLRNEHVPQEFSDEQIVYLSDLTDIDHINRILDNILIQRVVGTKNHTFVGKYLTKQLETLGYDVEIDAFQDRTPNFGQLTFKNIIATLNPKAERFLVLACHYDSKYFEDEEFVGATDSAVPCAMMLNLVHVMRDQLNEIKANDDVSLKLLFLDGEEAFLRWNSKDSIYGARHLAAKWNGVKTNAKSGEVVNHLQRIDAFILLDLLGAPDPTFFSYFSDTEHLFIQLADSEQRLSELGKLAKYSINSQQQYFKRLSSPSYIEDDHIPFLKRGVPILHIIPAQFPKVWHTSKDNRDVIDMNTLENLNKILRIFVAQYLHLQTPVTKIKPILTSRATIYLGNSLALICFLPIYVFC